MGLILFLRCYFYICNLEKLKKSRTPLSRNSHLWTEDQKVIMDDLFLKYNKLQKAYELAQEFKLDIAKTMLIKGI